MPKSSTKSNIGFNFNAKNKEAQRIAKKYAAEQVTNINTQTKLAIRRTIARSIKDQIPPREAAKLIKGVVGLNSPQHITLIRYANNLPPGLTLSAQSKLLTKYKNKLLRRRALMIARTEVMDALNTGVEVSWKQAQNQGLLGKKSKKEWMATFGACEICSALDGKSVEIDKSFGQLRHKALYRPTAHPNCRCAITPLPSGGTAVSSQTGDMGGRRRDWPISDITARERGASYIQEVDRYSQRYVKDLTPTQKSMVKDYTGNGYVRINSRLRRNPKSRWKDSDELQSMIDAAPQPPPPELVWRGIDTQALKGSEVGDTLRLEGFQSTSLDPLKADQFVTMSTQEHKLLEILPTRGLNVQKLSKFEKEYEILLPHNAEYRIVGKKKITLKGAAGYKKTVDVTQLEMLN